MLAEALFLAHRPEPQRGADPDGHERRPERGPVAYRAILDLADHMAKALQHSRHLPHARDHRRVGIRRAAPAASGKADPQLAGLAPDRVEIGNAWRTHMDKGTAVGHACQVLPHRRGVPHSAANHASMLTREPYSLRMSGCGTR